MATSTIFMEFEKKIKQTTFRNDFLKAVLNLKYTASWYNTKETEVFKKYGLLTQHFNVLRIVNGAHPNPLSPGKILEVMIEPGRDLTRLVDKMVKMGLLIRSTCPSNRRKVDIHSTQKGMVLSNKIKEEIDEFLGTIGVLTNEESKQLNLLLDKFRND